MRSITVPEQIIASAVRGDWSGAALYFPVEVDWPELRLTEAQRIANIGARLRGEPPPHDDNSVFAVVLPRIIPERERLCVACKAALVVIKHYVQGEEGESVAALLEYALDEPDPPEYSGGGR